jgi:acyl-CoA-binding protein
LNRRFPIERLEEKIDEPGDGTEAGVSDATPSQQQRLQQRFRQALSENQRLSASGDYDDEEPFHVAQVLLKRINIAISRGRPHDDLKEEFIDVINELNPGSVGKGMGDFLKFLKTKNLTKKPNDTQLKKLYKEFKGVKRLSGKGFWDDFKKGFNMVFEPASKYVLKPLMALSGTPAGLAGTAALTALGYGKKKGGNLRKLEFGDQTVKDTETLSKAADIFNLIPQDTRDTIKQNAKQGLIRLASAGLKGFLDNRKTGGAMSLEDTFKQFGENMKGQYNNIKSTLGLGKKKKK